MNYQETVTITKPAGQSDGYEGGLIASRDASACVGGNSGAVNVVSYTKTITGKQQTSFEWNNLSVLQNYSAAGENCARYAKAIRYGTGGTWGDCIELQDETANKGPAITLELDMFVQGPDTGGRVALDIVVGDSSFDNGGSKGNAVATAAIRVGAYLANAWARFMDGIVLKDFLRTGLVIGEDATLAKQGFRIVGTYDTAIDLMGAKATRFAAVNSMQGGFFLRREQINCSPTDKIVAGFRVTCDGSDYVFPLYSLK